MKTILVVLLVLLSSCRQGEQAIQAQNKRDIPVDFDNKDRISITRIQVVRDDVAYNYERGVYLIKDNTTGQEFIGISGIGISELGSHSSGKTSISDER